VNDSKLSPRDFAKRTVIKIFGGSESFILIAGYHQKALTN